MKNVPSGKRNLLYALTSLSFVFSVILRPILYNAFITSDLWVSGVVSDEESLTNSLFNSLFSMISLALYIVPQLLAVLFYNKSCIESGLKDCKLPFPFYFFGLGIKLAADIITDLVFSVIYGVMMSNDHIQDKPISEYTGLSKPEIYISCFCICVILNFIFWNYYFKKSKSAVNDCIDVSFASAKDIRKYSIIFSVISLVALNVITISIVRGLLPACFDSWTSGTSNASLMFYNTFTEEWIFIENLISIILSLVICNAVVRRKKYMKLTPSCAFISLAQFVIGELIVYAVEAVTSLIQLAFYRNSPEVYESLSEVFENSQYIAYIVASVVIGAILFKKHYMQKFNIASSNKTRFTPDSGPEEDLVYYLAEPEQQPYQENRNH